MTNELVGDGNSRADVATKFYSLNDLVCGWQYPIKTKVSEPADSNRNYSSTWASVPSTRFFCRVHTHAKPVRSISCRANVSEHMLIWLLGALVNVKLYRTLGLNSSTQAGGLRRDIVIHRSRCIYFCWGMPRTQAIATWTVTQKVAGSVTGVQNTYDSLATRLSLRCYGWISL